MADVKTLEWTLRITGLIVLGVGVIFGLADLRGWLRYDERQAFLQWTLESHTGMPISEPSAQAFMKQFPPPQEARVRDITHITKMVVRPSNGPVMQASFNYMHRDQSRTSHVATLADVREWAAESPYPWLAWSLALVGFLEVLGSTALQWRRERRSTAQKQFRPTPMSSSRHLFDDFQRTDDPVAKYSNRSLCNFPRVRHSDKCPD